MLGYGAWRAALEFGNELADLGPTTGECGWEMSASSAARVEVDATKCEGIPDVIGALNDSRPRALELEQVRDLVLGTDQLSLVLERDGELLWRGAVETLSQDPTGQTLTVTAMDWTNQAAGFHVEQDVVAPTVRAPGAASWTPAWDVAAFLAESLLVANVPTSWWQLDRIGVDVTAAVAYDAGVDLAQLLTAVADVASWTVIAGVLQLMRPYSPELPAALSFSASPSWWTIAPTVRISASHVTRVIARSTTAFGPDRRHLQAVAVDEAREAAGRRNTRIISSAFGDVGTLEAAARATLDALVDSLEIGTVSLAASAPLRPHDLHPGNIGEISTGTSPLAYEGPCSIARTTWRWRGGQETLSDQPQVTFAHPSANRRTRPYGTMTIGSIAADHERRLRFVEANGVSPKHVADAISTNQDLIEQLAPLGIFDV